MSNLKLQKFLADAGIASRRSSEELINQGKIFVNGIVAHIGQRVDSEKDIVELNGKRVVNKTSNKYFMVNKPVGYISTTSDELNRNTVLNLLPKNILTRERLYPVGRLDKDSEGLMLLTSDGSLTHKLTHPKFRIAKTYHVLLDREPTQKALEHLEKGVMLSEGLTARAEVETLDKKPSNHWISITIHEGRNRQVRRMLERVGYQTIRLIRTNLGPFSLADLGSKQYIELSSDQIGEIFNDYVNENDLNLL